MVLIRKRRRSCVNCCQIFLLSVILSLSALQFPVNATFRLCGFRLTMTLTAICKNRLCSGYTISDQQNIKLLPNDDSLPNFIRDEIDKTNEKRSYNDDFRIDSEHSNNNNNEILNKTNYFLFMIKKQVKRNGIATECCEKRCTLAYLRTYCCAGFQLPSTNNINNKDNKTNKNNSSLIKPESKLIELSLKNNLPKSKSISIMPTTYSENNERRPTNNLLKNSNKEFEILNMDAPVFTYEESPYRVIAEQPINLF